MSGFGRKCRGFLLADAIIAIGVVSILITTLGVALNKQSRASTQLAEQREQLRLAEEVMTSLQTGAAAPAMPQGFKVNVSKVTRSAAVGPAMAWARVVVTHGSHASELVGVVPAAAVKDGSP
jgi:type II secretory pathway pseudopilin PulG